MATETAHKPIAETPSRQVAVASTDWQEVERWILRGFLYLITMATFWYMIATIGPHSMPQVMTICVCLAGLAASTKRH